jgi:hypothetical protein
VRRAVALSIALLAFGCRKRTPEATASVDASAAVVDAAPVMKDEPFVLVAEGPGRITGAMVDDRVLIVAGPMLYDGKPDGSLAPVSSPSELATFIPDDDTVVGYSRTSEITGIGGSSEELLLQTYAEGGRSESFKRSNGKLVPLPVGFQALWMLHYRGHIIAWDMEARRFRWVDNADLPLPRVPQDIVVDPSLVHQGPGGSLMAHTDSPGPRRILVWKPDTEAPVVVRYPDGGGGECHPLRAGRDRYVMHCGMVVYELKGDTFARLFERPSSWFEGETRFGADGAIVHASYPKVTRCTADGACSTRELPNPTPQPVASYQLFGTEFVKSDAFVAGTWQSLGVAGAVSNNEWANIVSVMDRGPNDVWVVVQRSMRIQVFHTGSAPPKPKALPSATDARVALRNQRPPARWTGPCDQIYVRLGSDGDALASRVAEIHAALGAKETEGYVEAFNWALVEGTIGDQRGAGIVLARRSPEHKLAPMEKAVHALMTTFATGPGNEPPAYCTLPVLERKLLPKD